MPTHVNIVIIGAGAGGGIVAKELAEAGYSVVLLERGKWQGFDDLEDDELTCHRTQALACGYGPDNARYKRVIGNSDGSSRVVLPNEGGYGNNAACVGGGTLSYGAMAWRFMEKDFKMKSTYGAVKDSTLDDWPITYDDLEPCYEKAEWEIGVSGDDSQNPFAPPRKKPHPMPPFPYNREARVFEPVLRKLGWHPFPIPMLRNSIPYGGRNKCIHMRSCVGFACPVNAKNGTQNTVIPRALATKHCELRTQCVAAEIVVDDKGRAKGVNYFDADGKGVYQTADVVVVSASATETARLLLNSKSNLFPNGAGNNNDWVGRNLQGHGYPGAWAHFEQEIYEEAGPGACLAVCDFNHGNAGFIGGGALTNEFIRLPFSYTTQHAPGSARWGKAHKDYQRRWYRFNGGFRGPIQELPVFDARVQVDPSVKDHWGIPVARLSGMRHALDVELGDFMANKAELMLKEAGAIKIWKGRLGRGLSGGQHQAGTCRMGNDPKTSVTNRFGQVHQIDNLFIADGSLHVTNGGFNPVLTIMALGYWVSANIIKTMKGGKP